MHDPLAALTKIRALISDWHAVAPGEEDARFAAVRILVNDLIELEAETQFSDFIHEQLTVLRWIATNLYIEAGDDFAELKAQALELVSALEGEQGFGSFDRG